MPKTTLTYSPNTRVTLHPYLIPDTVYGGLYLLADVLALFQQQGYLTISKAIQEPYLSYYRIEELKGRMGVYLTDSMISGLYQPIELFSFLDIISYETTTNATFKYDCNNIIYKNPSGHISFEVAQTNIPNPSLKMYTLMPPKPPLTLSQALQLFLDDKQVYVCG